MECWCNCIKAFLVVGFCIFVSCLTSQSVQTKSNIRLWEKEAHCDQCIWSKQSHALLLTTKYPNDFETEGNQICSRAKSMALQPFCLFNICMRLLYLSELENISRVRENRCCSTRKTKSKPKPGHLTLVKRFYSTSKINRKQSWIMVFSCSRAVRFASLQLNALSHPLLSGVLFSLFSFFLSLF